MITFTYLQPNLWPSG